MKRNESLTAGVTEAPIPSGLNEPHSDHRGVCTAMLLGSFLLFFLKSLSMRFLGPESGDPVGITSPTSLTEKQSRLRPWPLYQTLLVAGFVHEAGVDGSCVLFLVMDICPRSWAGVVEVWFSEIPFFQGDISRRPASTIQMVWGQSLASSFSVFCIDVHKFAFLCMCVFVCIVAHYFIYGSMCIQYIC